MIGSSSFYAVVSKSSNNVQRKPQGFLETMMIHSLEYSERVQQDDKKEEEVMVQIEKGSVQEKKFQKMAKVDHDSWETWLEIIKTVTNVNQRLKVPLYVETQEIQEIHLIHIWIAESQTKMHLYCTRGAENFDMSAVS